MKEFNGRKFGHQYGGFGESIIVNGAGINIDRTHYAEEWNRKHDMKPEFIAIADDGERFTVWRSYANGNVFLSCAIPIKEE